jgi:hypothetical protein
VVGCSDVRADYAEDERAQCVALLGGGASTQPIRCGGLLGIQNVAVSTSDKAMAQRYSVVVARNASGRVRSLCFEHEFDSRRGKTF